MNLVDFVITNTNIEGIPNDEFKENLLRGNYALASPLIRMNNKLIRCAIEYYQAKDPNHNTGLATKKSPKNTQECFQNLLYLGEDSSMTYHCDNCHLRCLEKMSDGTLARRMSTKNRTRRTKKRQRTLLL